MDFYKNSSSIIIQFLLLQKKILFLTNFSSMNFFINYFAFNYGLLLYAI